jgi:hypothetical protein
MDPEQEPSVSKRRPRRTGCLRLILRLSASPFVVTVVGGIMLGFATSQFQRIAENNTRLQAAYEVDRQHKYEVFLAFASQFDWQIERWAAYRQSLEFIDSEKPVDDQGHKRNQVINQLHAQWLELSSKPSNSSQLSMITAFYRSRDVRKWVRVLTSRMAEASAVVNDDDAFSKAKKRMKMPQQELLFAMAREMRAGSRAFVESREGDWLVPEPIPKTPLGASNVLK